MLKQQSQARWRLHLNPIALKQSISIVSARVYAGKKPGRLSHGLLRKIILSLKCLETKRCRAFRVLVSSLFLGSEGAMEMSGREPGLGPSGHVDDFARRNLQLL